MSKALWAERLRLQQHHQAKPLSVAQAPPATAVTRPPRKTRRPWSPSSRSPDRKKSRTRSPQHTQAWSTNSTLRPLRPAAHPRQKPMRSLGPRHMPPGGRLPREPSKRYRQTCTSRATARAVTPACKPCHSSRHTGSDLFYPKDTDKLPAHVDEGQRRTERPRPHSTAPCHLPAP